MEQLIKKKKTYETPLPIHYVIPFLFSLLYMIYHYTTFYIKKNIHNFYFSKGEKKKKYNTSRKKG